MENFLKVGFSANGYLSGINVDDYIRNPLAPIMKNGEKNNRSAAS